jgi:hypothetical protein
LDPSPARGSRRGENQYAFLLLSSVEKCCSAPIYFFGWINMHVVAPVPARRGRKKSLLVVVDTHTSEDLPLCPSYLQQLEPAILGVPQKAKLSYLNHASIYDN